VRARDAGIAALLLVGAAAIFFATRPEAPAAPHPALAAHEEERTREDAPEPPPSREPVVATSTPAPITPVTPPAEEVVREAPGAPDRADGLDLPPPEIPTEPIARDPSIDEYRERAEHVPEETQLAYVRNSLHLLDGTIDSLESELAEVGPSSEDGRRLSTRIARMRQAREARAAELQSLAERAGVPPTEEPSDAPPRTSDAP
jgi:hypothetical protein